MGLLDFFGDIFDSETIQGMLSIGGSAGMFFDDVVHGTEWELESINEEAGELYKKTKTLMKNTKSSFTKAINAINKQRVEISETTLKNFSNVFSSLKNIEFDDVTISSTKVKLKGEDIELNIVEHEAGFADLLVELPIAGTGAWVVREFKLMDEVDEAKEELGRLIEECAIVRRKCSQIKSATRFLHTTHKTIKALKEFGDEFNDILVNIIDTHGVDYSKYALETRQQIRAIFNLQMALSYFVTESVVTSAGNIRSKYKKYITRISKNRNETEKYLLSEHFYLED